ncbi:hypothetical protein [Streptomyces niveus]|uniref:Uncharacterized protein n=1 Tax=Streptomyces niveus TaxID=193462 RepID=A0ABZ2AH36_STRNV|nr:hypothetical protein [Streptomyces niveus]
MTVLRATGWLSRNIHPCRAEPAGPQLAVPAAQMVGTSTVSFAVLPPGSGPRDAPPVSHPGLSVEGAVMTSLRRRDGELEVRLVAAPPNRPRWSYAARSPTPTESASWAPTTPVRPRPMANPARSGSRCGPGRS